MSARPHPARSLFRSLTAGILCALVLGLGLLAHWPSAHAWIHAIACETGLPHSHHDSAKKPSSESNASDPFSHDHICAITVFAQGVDGSAPAIFVAVPLSVSVVEPLPETKTGPRRIAHLLPPGRAPPRV
jgi:hypothetical protein